MTLRRHPVVYSLPDRLSLQLLFLHHGLSGFRSATAVYAIVAAIASVDVALFFAGCVGGDRVVLAQVLIIAGHALGFLGLYFRSYVPG